MLLTPALALLAVVFNFCALLHVTNNRNGHSASRWHFLDRDIYALDEATAMAYANYLDTSAPPPSAPSPVYSPALRHAEWAYRSSAVRIVDLVDGSSKARTASDRSHLPLLPQSPPSPTKPTDPVTLAVGLLPPTLTSPSYPATVEPLPTRDSSIPSTLTSPVAQSVGLAGFFCFVYTGIFAWLKNRHRPRPAPGPRPRLTINTNWQKPLEDFHSVRTVTPIPSYAGSEVDFAKSEPEGSPGPSRNSSVDYPTTPRTFPIVITNSDGQALFNAEIKFSSNKVVTTLSATTSAVSFSIDVVASLDVPPVSEWYVPAKEDGDAAAQADGSIFLLLVRGDRSPLAEEPQDSGYASETEDFTLPVDQTPQSDPQTLVPDVGDTDTRDVPSLGSPMCPITIPIHYRGYSSFETTLLNSGTKAHRTDTHKGKDSHRRRTRAGVRPRDVRFAWLKDLYTCGDDHLDGCLCEETLAEDALAVQYPPPHVMSEIFYDYDATPEFDRDTHLEERGSGMHKLAHTVSPGLSVRSEMSPTSISGPAEPRPTAHSDPSLADGKEPAGLDSAVALMPPFSVVSPELSPRCRSSGISTPAEFTDGTLGEQSMSLDEETWFTGEYSTGETRFSNGTRSPPSPVAPAQAESLLSALGPILTDYASPPSPEEAALVHPTSTFDYPGNSPLQYSPSSNHSPVSRPATPEYADRVGEPTGAVDNVDPEPASEVEP